MIRKLAGESWKPLTFPGWKTMRNRYAVSSMGRIASYRDNILEDGKLLNGSLTTGYRTLNLHRSEQKGTLYIHREVAKLFLKKPGRGHQYVIHKNFNKLDNSVKNLKWVGLEEMIRHQQESPAKKAYKKKQASRTEGLKLNAAQVKKIKNILSDKNRTLTIRRIAEQYGVSEMTVYRIKSGENWSKV